MAYSKETYDLAEIFATDRNLFNDMVDDGIVTPIEKDDKLTMQFEYDIIENNAIPREKFGDNFFNLIGDILMDILDEKYNTNDTRKLSSK